MSLNWWELDLEALAALTADDGMQFRPGLPVLSQEPGNGVDVAVQDIGAGVWARISGTLADGTPVTVSGAVVGGPDPCGPDVMAVAVRDHQGNPDVVVYIGADQHVTLVDDPATHAARAAHALAPVFGPVRQAIVMEFVGGRWVDLPPVDNPSPEDMADIERGARDFHLSAVYRSHLPIRGI